MAPSKKATVEVAEPNEAAEAVTPTRFRNVSPLGALDVPATGRVIHAGEVFEVRPDVAELLIAQPEHFAPAQGEPLGVPADETEGETDDHAA